MTSDQGEASEGYRICVRCVMDTSDPEITFDELGICNHCRLHVRIASGLPVAMPDASERLHSVVARIKADGRGNDYDCILGLSGGLDSSYLALLAVRLGLRPLIVHLDNGWDSELASMNISNVVQGLGLDLYTHVVDWEEFRDIQKSLLKASVIDLEMVTDHAIVALCYRVAFEHKVRTILSGNNTATESILPRTWAYRKTDLRNLRAIHREFGSVPMKTLPTAGTLRLRLYRRLRRIHWVELLDYVPYDREQAIEELVREVGYRPYEGKHGESMITRFYQGHILPTKFGVDKRRAHLSSLTCAGQLSRDEALRRLEEPTYDHDTLEGDKEYVAKKLDMSVVELEALLAEPPRSHLDYATDLEYLAPMAAVKRFIRRWLLRPRSTP